MKDGGTRGACPPPSLFLKSYLVRDVFLEIRFYVIPQGIQNFLGPNTHRGPCLLLSYAVCFKTKIYSKFFHFLATTAEKQVNPCIAFLYSPDWDTGRDPRKNRPPTSNLSKNQTPNIEQVLNKNQT